MTESLSQNTNHVVIQIQHQKFDQERILSHLGLEKRDSWTASGNSHCQGCCKILKSDRSLSDFQMGKRFITATVNQNPLHI